MMPFTTVQDPTQYFQAFNKQVQEGVKSWFKMTGAMLEEADKQTAESLKWLGSAHEQLIAARTNALKTAEENTGRALAMGESVMNSTLAAWRTK